MDRKVWAIFGKDLAGATENPLKQASLNFKPLSEEEKKRKEEESKLQGDAMKEAKRQKVEADRTTHENVLAVSKHWDWPLPEGTARGISTPMK